jgi:16S rRNA (guanine966-N2)-methyltransferase
MRIAGGTLKGRTVEAVAGSTTRPTTSALREAVFSALDHRITWNGLAVVDAFCGSGILGFEALSRGAHHVTFIDIDREVCSQVRQTAISLAVGSQCTIVRADALAYLRSWRQPSLDVVFADAPYHLCVGSTVLLVLEKLSVGENGLVAVIDHGPNEHVVHEGSWRLGFRAARGGSVIEVFERNETAQQIERQ